MKTQYLIVLLLVMLVGMQGVSLYREAHAPTISLNQLGQRGQRGQPRQESIRDAPKGATVDLKGLPEKGSKDAKVALIEFSDYECPFCARHATGVGDRLDQAFVTTGKVRQLFVNNPLPIHPGAKMLASAAICAGNQGQYWKMHDELFRATPKSKDEVMSLLKTVGIDSGEFKKCLESNDPAVEKQIAADMKKAVELNLRGTPSFAIGHVDSQGKVGIDRIIVGAQDYESFEKEINAALARSL